MKDQTKTPFTRMLDAESIALLERLSNAVAVSGDEGEVRAIVLEQVKPLADEVKVDALGNVLVTRKAKTPDALRVMLAAHMDEIGFMLIDDDEGGLYRFETIGGIDVRQLVGKTVWVGKQHTPAIIGARPIHLTSREERGHAIPLEQLRIDLGPEGKAKVGDRATFATTFRQNGPSLVGKALDNRFGVATLIELLKHAPDNVELLLAFTVQEEVGVRGARVAGYSMAPDLAFAIDSTPANDLPMWDGSENGKYNCRLGAGPAIYVADGGTLSDPRLVRHVTQTCDELGIPYQFRQPGGGSTDAGIIHKTRAGVPSISISVPGRYAHSAVLIGRLDDWQNTLSLLHAALSRLNRDLLAQPR
ncbi:cellulase M [Longilinea arvoryzae]|uniref:Cellulase M n=1 Tax=Longilinea arvoryzae TaxID=360412 RepID=A0A0S7BGU9_9CHLR|nr:M42 family peptidase [Longilinea arvoryzae]GAP13416.1 cellulase M [Longilinea arvoryzae]